MSPSPSELFEYLILGSKFVMLVVFVVLALINRETRYICKSPELFLKDALLLGGSSALSVVFISMMRTQSIPYEGVFTTFLLFFMYSIVRELSGYFPLSKNENLTPHEKQLKKKQPLVLLVVGTVVVVVLFLAIRSKVFPNENTYAYFPRHVYTNFLLETLIVALLTGVPEIVVDRNHETKKSHHSLFSTPSLATMATFGIAHIVFQMGGFYNIFFPSVGKTFSNSYPHGFGWQL